MQSLIPAWKPESSVRACPEFAEGGDGKLRAGTVSESNIRVFDAFICKIVSKFYKIAEPRQEASLLLFYLR
jgi:hypothetical protein